MSRLASPIFWQDTAETTLGFAAAGVVTVYTTAGNPSPYAVLIGAGSGALLGFCKSLSSLKVQPDNGTASYNPNVVAK